jgi:hypothetical protein
MPPNIPRFAAFLTGFVAAVVFGREEIIEADTRGVVEAVPVILTTGFAFIFSVAFFNAGAGTLFCTFGIITYLQIIRA